MDAGAVVGDVVDDELEDEELELVPPGGLDSSGKFYSFVSLIIHIYTGSIQLIPGLVAT